MKTRLKPIGFWSYARQDDESSQGKLSSLRSLLRSELQQQYGREDVTIFQDVSAIPPGEEWEKRIRESLDDSTFLIPIITPAFLQSPWCTREFSIFRDREDRLNREYPELNQRRRIFPILYVDVVGIEPVDTKMLGELKRLNWLDFTKLRLKDHNHELVRERLSELARPLRELLHIKVSVGSDTDEYSIVAPNTQGITKITNNDNLSPSDFGPEIPGSETPKLLNSNTRTPPALNAFDPENGNAAISRRIGMRVIAGGVLLFGTASATMMLYSRRIDGAPKANPQPTGGSLITDQKPKANPPPPSSPLITNQKPKVRTLSGHSSYVSSVAFAPDGAVLASGSSDKTIKLWQVYNGSELRTLSGHSDWVEDVEFAPSGKILASASNDSTIKVWNTNSGNVIRTLEGHSSWVLCVSFSPSGSLLASASDDKTVRLWRSQGGYCIGVLTGHLKGVWCVAFSPSGKRLASGSLDKTIILWDVYSQNVIRTFAGHSMGVESLAFSPDGEKIVSGSDDKTVMVWGSKEGTKLLELTGHSAAVTSVIFSSNGNLIFSASHDKTVRIWSASEGRLLRTLTGHTDIVYSVAISPDDKWLASASADRTVKLWDLVALMAS